MSVKGRAEIKSEPIKMRSGGKNRSSNQESQSMASFTRHHSKVPGVKSALLDAQGHSRERRKSPESSRPASGVDLEESRIGEEPMEEDENTAASSGENPPDNSP